MQNAPASAEALADIAVCDARKPTDTTRAAPVQFKTDLLPKANTLELVAAWKANLQARCTDLVIEIEMFLPY